MKYRAFRRVRVVASGNDQGCIKNGTIFTH